MCNSNLQARNGLPNEQPPVFAAVTGAQDFRVGDVLVYQAEGLAIQIQRRAEPKNNAQQFEQQHVHRMPVADVCLFVPQDVGLFFGRPLLVAPQEDGVCKRKGQVRATGEHHAPSADAGAFARLPKFP